MFVESESMLVVIHSEAPSIQLTEQVEQHICDVKNTPKSRDSYSLPLQLCLYIWELSSSRPGVAHCNHHKFRFFHLIFVSGGKTFIER